MLNAIIMVHINSETGTELDPNALNQIGEFTRSFYCIEALVMLNRLPRTLHKIHAFVEGQQNTSKIKRFFRHSEMSTLLKDCKAGLHQGLGFFQVSAIIEIVMLYDGRRSFSRFIVLRKI
jgi:hypothetical protein